METIYKFEQIVAEWYKSAPHMPGNGRRWLVENVWWLTLVGVILGALGIVSILFGGLFLGALLTGVGGIAGAAVGGLIFLSSLVWVALGVVCVALGAMAVNPLKARQRKGWVLLFIVLLIETVAGVVTNLLSYTFMGLIWGLLWAAVVGYLLFEIRSDFGGVKKEAKK